MPIRIVADGVVSRSVRDTAAFLRESERVYRNVSLPPIGDITRPARRRLRVAVYPEAPFTATDPAVVEETMKVAALLEELGHQVEELAPPVPDGFVDDFLLYWSFLAFYLLRTGRVTFGRSWDRTKVDNLSAGLAQHCGANLHPLPGCRPPAAPARHPLGRLLRRRRRRPLPDAGRARRRGWGTSTRCRTTRR